MNPFKNSKTSWISSHNHPQNQPSSHENSHTHHPSDNLHHKKAKVTHHHDDAHVHATRSLLPPPPLPSTTDDLLHSIPHTIKAIHTKAPPNPRKHPYYDQDSDDNDDTSNINNSNNNTTSLLSPQSATIRQATGLTPLAAQLHINTFKQQQQPVKHNAVSSWPYLPGVPLVVDDDDQQQYTRNTTNNKNVQTTAMPPPPSSTIATSALLQPTTHRAAQQVHYNTTTTTMNAPSMQYPQQQQQHSTIPVHPTNTTTILPTTPGVSIHTNTNQQQQQHYEDVGTAQLKKINNNTQSTSNNVLYNNNTTSTTTPRATARTTTTTTTTTIHELPPPLGQHQHTHASNNNNPSTFVSPGAMLDSMNHILTTYEKSEILHYRAIYYAGRVGVKKIHASINTREPNHGYDDRRGNYIIVQHDHIAYRYEVLHVLGRGSFGQVVCCFDHATGHVIALKIIRNKENFRNQAKIEASILTQLCNHEDHLTSHIVQMIDSFMFRNHVCITFELLSVNLYEYIKENEFVGCDLPMVRAIARQVLRTLCFLRMHNIVHCDIKPENILMTKKGSSSIKVVDFGSACYENQRVFSYIQSRFYRAPEVILGQAYGAPIDMWSLGCVLAEIAIGIPIFPGENETEQLYCIMEIMGLPPLSIVRHAPRAPLFFDMRTCAPLPPRPNSKGVVRRPGSSSLGGLMQMYRVYDSRFIQFLQRCLVWDPMKRMTPEEALQHQWLAVRDGRV